jgi:hypothetical protein
LIAKNLLALGAAAILLVANFFLINIGLLGSSSAQITIMSLWVVVMIGGVLLRRPWLIYGAQTIVSALILWRIAQYGLMGLSQQSGTNLYSLFFIVIIIIVTYILAWLCARAIDMGTVE